MAIAVVMACSCAPAEVPTPAAGPAEPRTAAAVDSRIMGVLEEGCEKLSAEAGVARRRATDPEVIRLAETIYEDCASFLANQRALGPMLGLTAASSTAQSRLEFNTGPAVEELSAHYGASFDRVFVDRIATDQDEILGLADSTMARSANNPQLKALIDVQLTPFLRTNIAAAKDLEARLRSEERRDRFGW